MAVCPVLPPTWENAGEGERGMRDWEGWRRHRDAFSMYNIWAYRFFVNNASLLPCANVQLHIFGTACLAKACMIFKCVIMMCTALCICWGNMVLWQMLKTISVKKRWNSLILGWLFYHNFFFFLPNTFFLHSVWVCLCVTAWLPL